MSNQRQRYISYLLRLWQTQDDERRVWRFSLESPDGGERHGFATLQDLVDFIQARIQSRQEKNET